MVWKALFLSYVPVEIKSVKILLQFDAQIKRLTGRPIIFAMYAAKILPKLPVGTHILTEARGIAPF